MALSTVQVDGTALRVRDSGDGEDKPVVILSAGIGQSLEFWAPQFDALTEDLRLIAWDYPNHGGSAASGRVESPATLAQTLIGLMDQLSVTRATLVGASFGAAVSLTAHDMAPERVVALAMSAPALMGPGRYMPVGLAGLPEGGAPPSESSLDQQIRALFHTSFQVPEALREAMRRNITKPGAAVAVVKTLRRVLYLTHVRDTVWQEHRAMMSRVDCPVLVIHGRRDRIVPFLISLDCVDLMEDADITILQDCGHTPHLENSCKFNDLLGGFVMAAAAQQRVDTGLRSRTT